MRDPTALTVSGIVCGEGAEAPASARFAASALRGRRLRNFDFDKCLYTAVFSAGGLSLVLFYRLALSAREGAHFIVAAENDSTNLDTGDLVLTLDRAGVETQPTLNR